MFQSFYNGETQKDEHNYIQSIQRVSILIKWRNSKRIDDDVLLQFYLFQSFFNGETQKAIGMIFISLLIVSILLRWRNSKREEVGPLTGVELFPTL